MKVIFLGVGEAFDENLSNSSHLILSDTTLLLDCGCDTPKQLWKYNPDQSFIDAIYVTHAHADHYFGIPSLLTRMWEEKRKKPLTIICRKGLKGKIKELLELGYKGIYERLEFELKFIEVEGGEKINLNELILEFALTKHKLTNLAIRVSDNRNSVCYSGDGMFTESAEKLYRDSDLVIHESYLLEGEVGGHGNIKDLIEMAEKNNVKYLALIHLKRTVRKSGIEKIKDFIKDSKVKVIVPEELEEYSFEG